MSDDIDAELDRLRQLLMAAVKERNLSLRALERQLGIKGGSTRKILKGDITLSVRHILMILKALGVPYAYFFRAVPLPERKGQGCGSFSSGGPSFRRISTSRYWSER